MIEISLGGAAKKLKVVNYALLGPCTDEPARGESRKCHDGPSPTSDMVQVVNLRIL